MRIALSVLQATDVEREGLPLIPANGIFLEQGDKAAMDADGYPFVLACYDKYMFVAHAEHVDVVDTIVAVFESRSVPSFDIVMSIQMYLPGTEDSFVEKARQEGIVYVSTMHPIANFLARVGAPIAKRNFVTIRRTE